MAEGGRGRNWRHENGDVFHRLKDASAFEIARGGLGDEVEHVGWSFGTRGLHVFQKNWTELGFFSGDGLREKLADERSEEKPPEIEDVVEAVKPERFDAETGLFEEFCGASDDGEGFGRGWANRGRVKKADADFAGGFERDFLNGRGDSERVLRVWTGEDFEENAEVSGSAGHGADDADPAVRNVARRKVA